MMSEAKTDLRSAVTVRRWVDVDRPERFTVQLDAIFFEASGTKSFASEDARAAFRERWFARYLVQHPQWAYVAMAPDGRLAGYIARFNFMRDGKPRKDYLPITFCDMAAGRRGWRHARGSRGRGVGRTGW